jgi:formylglycine-generating enzyme required for sulfatase activity
MDETHGPPPLPDGVPAGAQVPGYDILGELGRGGMGVVYKARHLTLNRVEALKMILHAAHAGPDERERFLREAEVIAAVNHPGVVRVHDFGTHEGAPYLAMEFCEGGNLAKKLAGKPLPPREAADLVEQTARAVQAAHQRGIVHRDLKPSNVLLTKEGAPKVSDFGLARRLDVGGGLTQTGAVMGTPSYVAPEQARSSKEAGPAADVYSLGAILYECLTGRPPFLAASPLETLQQVLSQEPPAPRSLNPAVPRDLETVCLKCLHKEPSKRYASAGALADDLRRWLAGEPTLARPAGAVERAAKWARRRPGLTAGLAGALIAVSAVLALAVVALYEWRAAERALADRDEAERRRALARIDALRDAAPGAVPGILDDLERGRAEVLGELRRRHAAEKDPTKRARLALALLPVEPEVRGELAEAMLEADDPAESVLIRDALRPYSRGLAPGLWAKADADDRRFRALVALAAFDPDSERWKKEAAPLAEALLGENPLHLEAWVLALEPVWGRVSGPLGRLFRDDRSGNAGPATPLTRREAAALALKVRLTRRPDPEMLFGLLLDADAGQHALLRPLLARHKEQAVARMRAELDRRPDYWEDGPLAEPWKAPDQAIVAEVEKRGGIVAERWALCQALLINRLAATTQALGQAGYRPVSVRPWRRAHVALVWARDGVEWKLEHGLTLEALKRRDAGHQKAGLIPADVAAYDAGEGVRYVGLWRRGDKDEKTVLYAGVPAAKLDDTTDSLEADGYVPLRAQAHVSGGSALCCGVWRKGKSKVWDLRSDDEASYKARAADGAALLLDLSAAPAAPPPWRDAWLASLQKARADAAKRPKDVWPYYRQGVALCALGRDREALEAFAEYHKRSKRFCGHYYRALLHARGGDARQAHEDLAAFAKADADAAPLTALTALVGVYLGDGDAALKKLDEAVEADKGPALAYHAARVYSRAAERSRLAQAAWAAALVGSPSPWMLAARPGPDLEARYADRAVELLRQAVSRGFGDFAAMLAEVDLEAIRPHPGYHDLLRRNRLLWRYWSVWGGDPTRQAEALQGLEPTGHVERCREMAAKGYRPVALSLADLPGEQGPLAASVWHRPVILGDREAMAKRLATAAALLLALGKTEGVWPLFRHSADPTRRSWLVWRAGERGADPKLLIDRLLAEKDDSARRALIVALGEYDGKRLPPKVREPLVEKLLGWYGDDPDPGVHSAISWLLRHKDEGPMPRPLDWGQGKTLDAIDRDLAGKKARLRKPDAPARADSGAGWYVNGQGHTMVMIKGPVQFRMGSPLWERGRVAVNEPRHLRRIPHGFAIASTAVTVEQYRRFLADNPDVPKDYTTRYSPHDRGPIVSVSWYAAARYCNWLSKKEGIDPRQWCYPNEIVSGMRLPPGCLGHTGYRLPTEAEWEYAARAGSDQARCFGSAQALLPRYANYHANSDEKAWPVGQKRPNDLGLFDANGNVSNWCHDRQSPYPGPETDQASCLEDPRMVADAGRRALRGGSFITRAPGVRSAGRYFEWPANRYGDNGLRVCRTLPPDAFDP